MRTDGGVPSREPKPLGRGCGIWTSDVYGVEGSAILAGVKAHVVKLSRLQVPLGKIKPRILRARSHRLARRVPRLRIEVHHIPIGLPRKQEPFRVVHKSRGAVPNGAHHADLFGPFTLNPVSAIRHRSVGHIAGSRVCLHIVASAPEVGVADWKHGRLPGREPRFNVVRLPIILWDVLVFLVHGNVQRVTTTHRITTCPSESQRVGAAPCSPETEREARQRVQVTGGVNRVVGVAVVGQDLCKHSSEGIFDSVLIIVFCDHEPTL
mmetsp:Transcript_61455/g.84445  ORF Transcript_61455/g.84445 Transcript_61455/m.84445 type:complete len:265 (-) Transcript_61455:57-851(-)